MPPKKTRTKKGDTAKLSSKARVDLADALDFLNTEIGGTAKVVGLDEKGFEAIPTGDVNLDAALGIGGFPKGLIVEIYGAESSGKTTLCTSVARQCAALGGRTLYVDVEQSFDKSVIGKLGFPEQSFALVQPDTGEEALDYATKAAKSGQFDVIVVDSVAALSPEAEQEGDMKRAGVGEQARMVGKGMRKLISAARKNNVTCIFINQLREKVGVMFGNPETTPGGRALKFFASLRLDMRTNRDGDMVDKATGKTVAVGATVKIAKSKICVPGTKVGITIMLGRKGEWGVSYTKSVLDYAMENDIIFKSGANYYWADDTEKTSRLANGEDNMYDRIRDDADFRAEMETAIKNHIAENAVVLEITDDELTDADVDIDEALSGLDDEDTEEA